MSECLLELETRLKRLSRLGEIAALVSWDQNTYMPPGAAESRAEQSSTLSQFRHELFTADETGSLLEKSDSETAGMAEDSDERRMISILRHDFDRATKLPTKLVAELSHHSSLSQETWINARKANDFASFAPALEKMFDLKRQVAECYGYEEHIYDALLDDFERGARQSEIKTQFEALKPTLITLAAAIRDSSNPVDSSFIQGSFSIDKQRDLTLDVVKALGYDLNRGRQDVAAHPFCTSFSRDDVRITTRFDENYIGQSLYASLHEAGHALYEQGLPVEHQQTALGGSASLGVHESQSRLWENQVGRSRAFCSYLYPTLKQRFPEAFSQHDSEAFYRAVNHVSPSLIRVEADEVTYNLHIMLRFELECELLTDKLAISDLPEAWNAKMRSYLGITPPDDASGVLQDVHWACGLVGYFPTYSLGNLLSAQIWNSAKKALPELDEQIKSGQFSPLLNWLRENVHQYGSKYTPGELIKLATGEPLDSRHYTEYLTRKFSDIYSLA